MVEKVYSAALKSIYKRHGSRCRPFSYPLVCQQYHPDSHRVRLSHHSSKNSAGFWLAGRQQYENEPDQSSFKTMCQFIGSQGGILRVITTEHIVGDFTLKYPNNLTYIDALKWTIWISLSFCLSDPMVQSLVKHI